MSRNISFIAVLLLLAGCGAKKTSTVATPGGTVTSTEDASGKTRTEFKSDKGEVTVDEKDGHATAEIKDDKGRITNIESGKNVDLSGMGVPIYPGATVAEEGKAAATVTGESTSATAVGLVSSDPPAKVVDWYAKQLKAQQTTTGSDGGMVMGKNAAGDQVIVVVSVDEGKTNIGVQVMKGP